MFIVFDLDGTLANIEHRRYLLNQRNWRAFFAACVDDLPNHPVIDAFNSAIAAGHRVEIWSARSDEVRSETERWLTENGIDRSRLANMRSAGDYMPDVALKRKWLLALHPDERPDVIYDDRQRVVDMWRNEGVTCFQVAADWERHGRTLAPLANPLLTIMVGPSGGGKSDWCAHNVPDEEYLSSDRIRGWLCGGDESDQSRNADVFFTLHKLARARLECGLPVTIDATNLRRKDRLECVSLAPAGANVRYVVSNLPMSVKMAKAGRRADVVMADGKSLIEAHEQRFQSQVKEILRGDGLPNVSVLDMRWNETEALAA